MLPIHWQSIVDFLVLAIAIYFVLRWGREARALRISLGIVALRAGSLLARQFDLPLTSWVLDAAFLIAVVLLLVIFQPELRHALMRLDLMSRLLPRRAATAPSAIRTISMAAFSFAESRRGALIVVVRRDSVAELVRGAVPLGGQISAEILEAIFRKVSPVHDGATIIEGDHIASVAAILPLTTRDDVPKHFGTRHRAAMGLAERCDALVIVVSEERGEVTLVYDREIHPMKTADELAQRLRELQVHAPVDTRKVLRQVFLRDLSLKAAAVGLASLVWVVTFFVVGTSVRTVTVPVEFRNVPPGMEIAQQSATAIQVQLRGNAWLFDSINLTKLSTRFDLSGVRQGTQTLTVEPQALNLPPGIVMERVSPQKLTVNVVRR